VVVAQKTLEPGAPTATPGAVVTAAPNATPIATVVSGEAPARTLAGVVAPIVIVGGVSAAIAAAVLLTRRKR
jgi:hypothetical protein